MLFLPKQDASPISTMSTLEILIIGNFFVAFITPKTLRPLLWSSIATCIESK